MRPTEQTSSLKLRVRKEEFTTTLGEVRRFLNSFMASWMPRHPWQRVRSAGLQDFQCIKTDWGWLWREVTKQDFRIRNSSQALTVLLKNRILSCSRKTDCTWISNWTAIILSARTILQESVTSSWNPPLPPFRIAKILWLPSMLPTRSMSTATGSDWWKVIFRQNLIKGGKWSPAPSILIGNTRHPKDQKWCSPDVPWCWFEMLATWWPPMPCWMSKEMKYLKVCWMEWWPHSLASMIYEAWEHSKIPAAEACISSSPRCMVPRK